MILNGKLGLKQLVITFKRKIAITWILVLFENALMALIPLFIGFTIDELLKGNSGKLFELAGIFLALTAISVVRRIVDTRIYGTVRVRLAAELESRNQALPVSTRNARLSLARELVDFLEIHAPEIFTALIQLSVAICVLAVFITWLCAPEIFTALIQLSVAICVLAVFSVNLAISAVLLVIAMSVSYAFFHQKFFRLNSAARSRY